MLATHILSLVSILLFFLVLVMGSSSTPSFSWLSCSSSMRSFAPPSSSASSPPSSSSSSSSAIWHGYSLYLTPDLRVSAALMESTAQYKPLSLTSIDPLRINSWSHVVLTRNQLQFCLYVNDNREECHRYLKKSCKTNRGRQWK